VINPVQFCCSYLTYSVTHLQINSEELYRLHKEDDKEHINNMTTNTSSLKIYNNSIHNKKLCYGRETVRRACHYRKKLAIDEWPWHTPKVITVAATKWPYGISLPVCGLLFQRLYLRPFSRHYHFWSERDCLWPWEHLYFWQRSLNHKQLVPSNLCVSKS